MDHLDLIGLPGDILKDVIKYGDNIDKMYRIAALIERENIHHGNKGQYVTVAATRAYARRVSRLKREHDRAAERAYKYFARSKRAMEPYTR